MTTIDTARLRALALAAQEQHPDAARHAVDAFITEAEEAFDGAFDPQTMLALLDETERLRGEDAHWEYGKQYTDEGGNPREPRRVPGEDDLRRPDGHRADGTPYWNFTAVRRRKAGPWEPIPEGDGDA